MKFIDLNSTVARVSILILSMSILWFGYDNTLQYFIHPRYTFFTISMCVVALFISSIAIISKAKSIPQSSIFFSCIVLMVCFLIAVWPPRSLSSNLVEKRSIYSNTPHQNIDPELRKNFCETALKLPITSLYAYNQTVEYCDATTYLSLPVTVQGFVDVSSHYSKDKTITINRYIMSCCAVDARPLQAKILSSSESYKTGQWVKVKGTISLHYYQGKSIPVISPETIQPIEEPETPYEYATF